jgi:hypothetical protein
LFSIACALVVYMVAVAVAAHFDVGSFRLSRNVSLNWVQAVSLVVLPVVSVILARWFTDRSGPTLVPYESRA